PSYHLHASPIPPCPLFRNQPVRAHTRQPILIFGKFFRTHHMGTPKKTRTCFGASANPLQNASGTSAPLEATTILDGSLTSSPAASAGKDMARLIKNTSTARKPEIIPILRYSPRMVIGMKPRIPEHGGE
ncbi:MAG TPA: hypothetical protein PKC88_06030, partial [Plasticicumulans sp.]|nr:hypothetical protein [Plasticicumulans sp.]